MRASWVAWVRTHKLHATLAPVLVLVFAVGIGLTVASSGGDKSGNAAASASSGGDKTGNAAASASSGAVGSGGGKSSAAASSGSSRRGEKADVVIPTEPAVTKGEKWVTGPANKLLNAVTADVGKISADQRAGQDSAVKDLGASLTADAKAALDGPMPPVDTAVYRAALEDFEEVGIDATSGNFSEASPLLTTANLDIIKVTTAANLAAPVNPPAQDDD